MNISIQPTIDGIAGERLYAFAMQLADSRLTNEAIRKLVSRCGQKETAVSAKGDSL